jgi:putative membrane protein
MKRMIWSKVLVLAGASIAMNMAWADDNTAATNQPVVPLTEQQFVSDAAVGGMKEVYLSQLALEKSTNDDLKGFANHMIKDHTAANVKLAKLAQAEGYDFPPTNTFAADDANWNNPLLTHPEDIKGGQMLTMTNLPYLSDYRAVQQLMSLSGNGFDQAYLEGMVQDHSQAVNEFETAGATLTDAKLKKFAEKTLPTLRKHSQMAQELNDKYNSMASGTNTNSTAQPSQAQVPVNPM